MYRQILVAIDVDDPVSWERSLPVAVALARCFSAKLTLCSVLRDTEVALEAQWSPIAFRDLIETKRAKLDLIARDASCTAIDVEVEVGSVIGGILHMAEASCATDLIVIHSHHPAFRDYFLPGNAVRIARRAPCSVFIVRTERRPSDPRPDQEDEE